MEHFAAAVLEHLHAVDWQGPAAFVVALLAVFALFRKWSMFLLVILTIVLGWGLEDMIVMNLQTDDAVVSVPLLVYVIGSGAIMVLAFSSLFKSK
jgi:uncharacterized membrane protein